MTTIPTQTPKEIIPGTGMTYPYLSQVFEIRQVFIQREEFVVEVEREYSERQELHTVPVHVSHPTGQSIHN